MSTAPAQTNASNGVTAAHDLFALTDEQILEIQPDAQDVEIFGGERSDRMDPLRADLELLASETGKVAADDGGERRRNGEGADDGLKAVATTADSRAQAAAATEPAVNADDAAPHWLAER